MSEKYTTKTLIPQYTPKPCPPQLKECVDNSKYKELKERIITSNVTELEKKFLLCAAHRHYIFNYSKIADYYASASPEMQELMEDSALVIIDYDDAVSKGYVKLSKRIAQIVNSRLENNDA